MSITVAELEATSCRIWIPKSLVLYNKHFIHQNTFMIAVETPFSKEVYILDALSAWGGRDSETNETLSWEFAMSAGSVVEILQRLFINAEIKRI